MIAFWMLPPDRFLMGVSRLGVFTANSLISDLACAAILGKSRKIPCVNWGEAWSSRKRFSCTENSLMAPSRMRSSGMKACPAFRRSVHRDVCQVFAVYDDGAGGHFAQPAQASCQLALPVARHARQAQDLTGANLQVNAAQRLYAAIAHRAQPLNLEQRPAGFLRRRREALDLAADHHRRQLVARDILRGKHSPLNLPSRSTVMRSLMASTS